MSSSGVQISETRIPELQKKVLYIALDFESDVRTSFTHVGTGEIQQIETPEEASKLINPLLWSPAQKRFQLALACLAAASSSFAASSYGPAIQVLAAHWNISSRLSSVNILSFTMGVAFSLMFLAPLSELKGRRPVVISCGILFIIGTVLCAITQWLWMMILGRFLAGFGASSFAMGGGIISDIFVTDRRGIPMAIFSGSAIFGIGLGSVVSGCLVEHPSWRWVYYMQVIAFTVIVALVGFGTKESRPDVVLLKKSDILNRWHEKQEREGFYASWPWCEKLEKDGHMMWRVRWKPRMPEHETMSSPSTLIKRSLLLPIKLLLRDRVVFFFALWVSFSWSILYICLSAVVMLFERKYGFSLALSNAFFAAECIGAVLATFINIYQDWLGRTCWRLGDEAEGRLFFVRIEAALLPIGLLLFGWAGEEGLHWIVPAWGICITTIGITIIYVSVFNYLADSYGTHASSALAALGWMKDVMCGFFPLMTADMLNRMGYGGACTLFAGIGFLLSAVPWVLIRWGPQIRDKSIYAIGPSDSSESDKSDKSSLQSDDRSWKKITEC